MSDWFYVLEGKQQGPVSEEELDKLQSAGTLSAEVTVWKEGMPDWLPINERNTIVAAEPEAPEVVDVPSLEGLSGLKVMSILACLVCLCNPFAAFALVYYLQAKNANQDGRIDDAQKKLKLGKRMVLIAFISSTLIYTVLFYLISSGMFLLPA